MRTQIGQPVQYLLRYQGEGNEWVEPQAAVVLGIVPATDIARETALIRIFTADGGPIFDDTVKYVLHIDDTIEADGQCYRAIPTF
jgi:hypothetical protein